MSPKCCRFSLFGFFMNESNPKNCSRERKLLHPAKSRDQQGNSSLRILRMGFFAQTNSLRGTKINDPLCLMETGINREHNLQQHRELRREGINLSPCPEFHPEMSCIIQGHSEQQQGHKGELGMFNSGEKETQG